MDGNSYMYPMYTNMGRGYSQTTSPQEITHELKGLMQEITDPAVKTAISEVITKVNK